MSYAPHSCQFWYIFWDDLWSQNKEVKRIYTARSTFDPASPKSIAYKPSKPVCRRPKVDPLASAFHVTTTLTLTHVV